MGIYAPFSCDRTSKTNTILNPSVSVNVNIAHPNDPNPRNYEIKKVYYYKDYVIAKIHYLNCINFEGVKILVFKGVTEFNRINDEKNIDPHFLESNNVIARFRPGPDSFQIAINFVKSLYNSTNNKNNEQHN